MLQTIRDRAQGWIAWAIVILISIPFALWGIQSYLGVGGEPIAAEVNGVEIAQRDLDRRVQMARWQLRERLGAAYDTSQLDDRRLRREVLDDMIREVLLVDISKRMGLAVSDAELRARLLAEPAFQRDGQFDKNAYERVLQLQGLSPPMFEAQLRQQIVGTQLIRAVTESELTTSAERAAFDRLAGQKREVTWLPIPVSRFETDAPVPDEEIAAYYEKNPERFRAPEQVKLDYLVLDVDSLAKAEEVPEEELERAYESDQARFGQPERRRVRHLLLTVPPRADEATAEAVRTDILALRERIQGGESFAEVAREASKDPGSGPQGGDLGTIERGLMDPAFDQATFDLEPGQVSEPVRTRFGWHLILVEAVEPASVKPFEEVRAELEQELARQRAESLFYDMGERLANVVYESPDSLEPAAEELGLEIRHSDWISREGGEGLLGHPKVTAAAFGDDVLVSGRNSDLIEPEKDVLQAVVIRVADHREATAKPLEEVRDEIAASLREERARQAAAAAAEAAAERLRTGAHWEAAAAAAFANAGTGTGASAAQNVLEPPSASATGNADAAPIAAAAPAPDSLPDNEQATEDSAAPGDPAAAPGVAAADLSAASAPEPAASPPDAPAAAASAPVPDVEQPGLVGRRDPRVPAPVRAVAFTLPVPPETQASVGTAAFDNGDSAVVRVTRVEDGEVKESGAAGAEASMLVQLLGRQAYDAMIADMERRAEIERRSLGESPEG